MRLPSDAKHALRQGAVFLIFCAAALLGPAGCSKSVPPPPVVAPPTEDVSIAPSFRGSATPQQVTVIEDDPTIPYVRVQREKGDAFYVHRDFVEEKDGKHVLLAASDLFGKPQGEEYYFRLSEIDIIRDKIPGVFMTRSGRQVVAPWKIPIFENKGDTAWPVYECLRADCPGREKGAKHGHLFILAPPTDHAKFSLDRAVQALNAAEPSQEATSPTDKYLCPRCRELGKPAPGEAHKQSFRRYRLPESEQMWQTLDDEYQRSRATRVRKFNPAGS
ncbi:MAG: hypothetical protein K8T91_11375 [Planctomycetes bacterium]|nr:hypothetical protein [Planctomycetota bacterium]